jgi:hypothetical protein
VLALACAWTLLTATLGQVSSALADGDPASDVLASQSLFLPADGGFSPAQAAQLTGVLSSAQRSGFPIRLAVIATPADLGSVSALWRMPASYAEFLGKELPLVFHGTLLVVMPDGFGVSRVGGATAGGGTAGGGTAGGGTAGGGTAVVIPGAASLPTPRPGESMVTAAAAAVTRLSAAAGHPLAVSSLPARSSPGGSWLGSVDLGSWLALAAGAALIAVAWSASLRARPPARLRRAR